MQQVEQPEAGNEEINVVVYIVLKGIRRRAINSLCLFK